MASRRDRRGSASTRNRGARPEPRPAEPTGARGSPGTRGGQGGGRSGGRRRDGVDSGRLIVFAAAGVIALAALIVVAGFVFTQVLPPRSTVASVEGREFTAADAARRATYNAVFEGGLQTNSIDQLARDGIALLISEEILRQRGPDLVGPVTAEELQNEIRRRIGLAVPGEEDDGADPEGAQATATPDPDATGTPQATGTAEATATGTPEATAIATATPEATATGEATEVVGTTPEEEYEIALTGFLERGGIERADFEGIVEAEIIAERLEEHFADSAGEHAPHVHLLRFRSPSRQMADDVRAEALAGGDFEELIETRSAGQDQAAGDLGWLPVETLTEPVRDGFEALEEGAISEVVTSGLFFEVYKIVAYEDEREFDDSGRAALVRLRLERWFDEQRAALAIESDVSSTQRAWIADKIVANVNEIFGG